MIIGREICMVRTENPIGVINKTILPLPRKEASKQQHLINQFNKQKNNDNDKLRKSLGWGRRILTAELIWFSGQKKGLKIVGCYKFPKIVLYYFP